MNKMYTTDNGSSNGSTALLTGGSLWNRLSIKKGMKQLMVVALFLMCGLMQKSWGQSVTYNLTSSFTPVICGVTSATTPTAGSGVTSVSGSPSATSGYSGVGFPVSSTAPTTTTVLLWLVQY